MDACFLDFGGLPEIGNFPSQLPLQLTAFWLRAWGGYFWRVVFGIFMDCPKSTISLHSVFHKIQRIPFNRLLTAFLRALFQQASVEQIQRIPFNRLLMAIFWVPLLAVYCGRLFSGFWRAARNRQFPFTASLTTDSFLAPRLGGYFWRVVFWIFHGLLKIDNFPSQRFLQNTMYSVQSAAEGLLESILATSCG